MPKILDEYILRRGFAIENSENASWTLRKKDNVIYFEGEPAKELYLIKSGKVRLTKKFSDKDDFVTDTLGDGEFFGVVATMARAEYDESATVLEDAQIYALKPSDFNDLIAKNLRVGFKLFSSLSDKLRDHNRTIEKLVSKENDNTTAEKLLEIGEYYYQSHQLKQAEYIYRKYIELYPTGKAIEEVQQRIISIQTRS